MARLIVDLKNKDNKLYDACGNTWVYNNGDSNIPSDLIINGPVQGSYGFKTSKTNIKYIKLSNKGSAWNASPSTMNTFSMSLEYKASDGWCLFVIDMYPSGDDEGWSIWNPFNLRTYKYYPGTQPYGLDEYPTITNSKQVDSILKNNSVWHELWVTVSPSETLFFVNGVKIGYLKPQIHPFLIRKSREFYLGTWHYNPSEQTTNTEWYRVRVYDGIKYPPDPSSILKVY